MEHPRSVYIDAAKGLQAHTEAYREHRRACHLIFALETKVGATSRSFKTLEKLEGSKQLENDEKFDKTAVPIHL